MPALCVQRTPLFVSGLGLPEPGLVSSTLLQGNTIHGHMGLCAALLDPTVTFWNSGQLGRCYGGELVEEDASS